MNYGTPDNAGISPGGTSEEGSHSALGVAAAQVIKGGKCRLFRICVTTAGSAAGTVNDCATTGAAAAANLVASIPNAVGIYYFNWPILVGLCVTPGSGQVFSVSYGVPA